MNLLVSFSAWAELVWRYLLEVTKIVNPSSIPGSTLKTIVLTLYPNSIPEAIPGVANPNPNPNPKSMPEVIPSAPENAALTEDEPAEGGQISPRHISPRRSGMSRQG